MSLWRVKKAFKVVVNGETRVLKKGELLPENSGLDIRFFEKSGYIEKFELPSKPRSVKKASPKPKKSPAKASPKAEVELKINEKPAQPVKPKETKAEKPHDLDVRNTNSD